MTACGKDARAAAPAAAYCWRRSSCALADHGISSQSRQTQSVENSPQKSALVSAARKRASNVIFELLILKKAAAGARITDTAFTNHAEAFPCDLLITTNDNHRARAHVLFLA